MSGGLVTGIVDAQLDKGGEFLFIALDTQKEIVKLALPVEGVHDLILLLLRLLSDGTTRGILPPHLVPTLSPALELDPQSSGVRIIFDLSDGLRILSELPWSAAEDLAEKLADACRDRMGRNSAH